MKKVLSVSIIILVSILFFVSCNSDAEHGIYQQISTSSSVSSIKITDFLGKADNCYYYLNENGIFKFDSTGHKALVKNTPQFHVSGAYLKDASQIYFIDSAGKLYLFNGTKSEKLFNDKTFGKLFSNGYLKDLEGSLYFISSSSNLTSVSSNSKNEATYENYIAFYNTADSKFYLYNEGTKFKELKMNPSNGFAVSGDYVYIVTSSSLYKEGVSEALIPSFSYTKQDNNVIPVFCSGDNVYLKFSDEFLVYSISDGKQIATPDYLKKMATVKMISCKQNYISTYQNGLYELKENSIDTVF